MRAIQGVCKKHGAVKKAINIETNHGLSLP